jgi:hypothetical protein
MDGSRAGGREFQNAVAWISVAGAFEGTSSSSLALRNPLRALAERVRLFAQGRPSQILRETASETWKFKGEVPVPSDFLIASIVGVPYPQQVPRGLFARYQELAKLGPNDGMVLCTEAVVNPSAVIPIQGMSHDVEAQLIKPVLLRVLAYFACDILNNSLKSV